MSIVAWVGLVLLVTLGPTYLVWPSVPAQRPAPTSRHKRED